MQILSVFAKPTAVVSTGSGDSSKARPYSPVALVAWVLFCVFCNSSGWILSAFHQLNTRGYAIVFALSAGLLVIFRNKIFRVSPRGIRINKLRRRSRRLFPFCFLILAALAFAGGLL